MELHYYFINGFRIMSRYFKNLFSETKYPFLLTILLTSKCTNFSICEYCWRPKKTWSQDDISLEKISKLLKEKIPMVLLSGGEPTLHPDFKEIVNSFEKINTTIFILSNGKNYKLISESITNKTTTNVMLSITTYDTKEKIKETRNAFDYLQNQGIKVYLNIPIDVNSSDLSFFTDDVIAVLKMAKRVYITPFTRDVCELSDEKYDEIKRFKNYISKKIGVEKIVCSSKIKLISKKIYSYFAWLIDCKFDDCSAFPFRATMLENGEIVNCIKKGNSKNEAI